MTAGAVPMPRAVGEPSRAERGYAFALCPVSAHRPALHLPRVESKMSCRPTVLSPKGRIYPKPCPHRSPVARSRIDVSTPKCCPSLPAYNRSSFATIHRSETRVISFTLRTNSPSLNAIFLSSILTSSIQGLSTPSISHHKVNSCAPASAVAIANSASAHAETRLISSTSLCQTQPESLLDSRRERFA